MDEDILIERINRIYDDLRENGLMEDMTREEHETLMLSIAHNFRELESRERIFILNPQRYKLVIWIHQQICNLLDSSDAKYEIYIQEHLTFTTSVSIVVLIESLDISAQNISALKSIMPHIDGFSLWPGDRDRLRMAFEISNVYLEIATDREPTVSHADEKTALLMGGSFMYKPKDPFDSLGFFIFDEITKDESEDDDGLDNGLYDGREV